MDELDRLFRRLVANLAELDRSRLHRPFAVAELYESLVPYRTHRAQLGIDTSEDYEMAVLRLLSGERGYASVDPKEAREALAREVQSVNPDTGLFRRYASAKVRLDPDRVSDALNAPAAAAAAAAGSGPEADATFTPAEPPPDGPRRVGDEEEPAEGQLPFVLDEEGEETPLTARPRELPRSSPCPYCGGELPVGRAVLFCPHCGQNVGVVHCPTCGSELDVGWRFCITCGRKMTGLG